MKPLKFCVHGDGNPVCPPSKVLCREHLEGISDKFQSMVDTMENKKKEGDYEDSPPCR